MQKFINRQLELNTLTQKWNQKKSQFIIIYGKRRVGKTELIKQFIKNKPSVYFLAEKTTVQDQLKELGRIMGSHFKDSILLAQGFPSWLDVFKYLKEKVKKPFVFGIDEFPYLVETDNAISSIFQKGWDEYLKNSPVFLILSGSSVAIMESETLLYKSPLFGRRTGQIFLKPLTFEQSWEFFPQKSFDDFLAIYSLTGGMPAYLLQIESLVSLEKNIKAKIFTKTEYLHNEVEFILREELREPRVYMSILKAISWNKTRFGEIANETGLEKNIIQKYLGVLEKLQLIEREVPVTEISLDKSRKGIYKICDNFVRFWFQYVFPYRSGLEIENYNEALAKFQTGFPIIQSIVYERVAQEILRLYENELFSFERIGRWWDGKEEIDVVGINSETKEIVFGEAKWSNKPIGTNIYYNLKNKTQFVQWNISNRKEYFVLFSKSGFTADMCALSKKEHVILIEKDKLLK